MYESEDGQLFIAMAFYEGQSLQERIARGPLSPAETLDIGIQVLDPGMQDDAVKALAGALQNLRPEGVVVILESVGAVIRDGPNALPPAPVYDRVIRWKCEVIGGVGADLWAGLRLPGIFHTVGLPDPHTLMETHVCAGEDHPVFAYMAETVRSLLPQARRLGIEGFDESSVERLEEQLRAASLGGVVLNWPVVAAWTRRP